MLVIVVEVVEEIISEESLEWSGGGEVETSRQT